MITNTQPTEVIRSSNLQEQQFTIKATATSFQILSSGLYSDKIKAVVRELSCNAYDAHVAAGNSSTPIEIRLPNSMNPDFYVKDFGTGLNHEDMLSLYTTYFESSKQDSNDFIGALGLGSKSPYSYTSNFTVESRHNGMKRIYVCFLNEQKLPSITMMSEEVSDEPNGLTVMMSVKQDDIYKFNEAAKKALMYFNPMPTIIGDAYFAPYYIKHTMSGSNWKIRENDYYAYMNGPHLVQGFVAYPIDRSVMADANMSETANTLSKISIDFDVNIGDVEVAASREALQYDVRTVSNLTAIFELAAVEMRESFQKSFDACGNEWEVGVLMEEFNYNPSYEFRKLYQNMHKSEPFTWNGKPVSSILKIDFSRIKNTTITGYQLRTVSAKTLYQYKKWYPFSNGPHEQRIKKDIYMLVDNKTTGNGDVYRQYLNSLPRGVDDQHPTLLVIRPTSKATYDQVEIDTLISMFGNPRCMHVNDTGMVSEKIVSTTPRSKRISTQRLLWSGFPRHRGIKDTRFTNHCWAQVGIDMDAGGFYIPVHRYRPSCNQLGDLDLLLNDAAALGIIPSTILLYGFNEKEEKGVIVTNAVNENKWVNIFDYLLDGFHVLNVNDNLSNVYILPRLMFKIGSEFCCNVVNNWDMIAPVLADGAFKQFMSKLVDIKKVEHCYQSRCVNTLMDALSVRPPESLLTDWYQEWYDLIINQYDMLTACNLYNSSTDQVDIILKYVNMIESQLTSV